jgi:hypothetical protein
VPRSLEKLGEPEALTDSLFEEDTDMLPEEDVSGDMLVRAEDDGVYVK